MGIKSLFFTREDEHLDIPSAVPTDVETVSEVTEVTTSDVLEPSLIYESASIEDGTNNIYKIVAFIDGLTGTLDSIAKKEILKNILPAAGLDIDALYADASERMNALDNYGKGAVEHYNSEVERIDSQVEELNSAIHMLEDEKRQKGLNAEKQVKIVKEEITRLKTLQSYVEKGE